MEYLPFVYTLLLVAICLMMAVLLARTSRLLKEPKDDEALKSWLEQQLAAQAKDFSAGAFRRPDHCQNSLLHTPFRVKYITSGKKCKR